MRDTIHDCCVDISGVDVNELTIDKILQLLPKDILIIAEQWGPNDTEFRDKVFIWIKEHKDFLKEA